jgi:hypothetical protein
MIIYLQSGKSADVQFSCIDFVILLSARGRGDEGGGTKRPSDLGIYCARAPCPPRNIPGQKREEKGVEGRAADKRRRT